MTAKLNTKLFTDCINQPAVEFDWSQGYGETWNTISPVPAWSRRECVDYIDSYLGYEFDSDDIDELRRYCDECRDADGDCPILGYYYPLPHFDPSFNLGISIHEAQHAIRYTNCVIVELSGGWDGYALALQGGGMDLSWDICEAHILLGYYPPLEYCELPRYANVNYNKRTKRIINACIESARIAERWAKNRKRDLLDYRRELLQQKQGAKQ